MTIAPLQPINGTARLSSSLLTCHEQQPMLDLVQLHVGGRPIIKQPAAYLIKQQKPNHLPEDRTTIISVSLPRADPSARVKTKKVKKFFFENLELEFNLAPCISMRFEHL